ncbi:MAG: dephospho-CoA kinase [Oscillospiraceae bacterium]|nr:dephospho-CoA kinase [Oscillospiraceae bacterium]
MEHLPNIKIIGLTGMSGAGKSTACEVFRRRGFSIVDCDKIAWAVASDRDFLNELQSRFPEKLLNDDGSLNRVVTAKAIFGDESNRRLYNQIIFPYIGYRMIREIRSAGGDVLLDAPTLFDAGLEMICTEIVGVTASAEICARRIIKRDSITPERAAERLSAQYGEEFLKEHCDHIIENNGAIRDFIKRAEKITDKLKGGLW